jgi:magnesium-transporting ATPase (P-type)
LPIIEKIDSEGRKVLTDELERMDAFRNVIRELRVLSRASPLDKEILVRGLKCMG